MPNPIGQAKPETIAAAMALPVAHGPVVFIGAPWLLTAPTQAIVSTGSAT